MTDGDFATSYESAVREVAGATNITLVVGAGASVESGLPSWPDLVRHLLLEVAHLQDLRGAQAEEFVAWLIEREGLIASGSIARACLGPDFDRVLHAALYRDTKALAPGETARAAASLRLAFSGSDSELATTNYDSLLKDALHLAVEDAPAPVPTVIAVSGPQHVDRDQLAVRHLHGVQPIARRRSGASVVLSDSDYHLMQHDDQWQELYFSERLANSLCVFVGTSLTDPNLLRYLYRNPPGGQHLAVFSRQQESDLYTDRSHAVRDAREKVARARWEAVCVRPVQVDYFSQSAQLLCDAALLKRDRSNYRPLEERLSEWETRAVSYYLSRRQRVFTELQDNLQRLLVRVVDVVTARLAKSGSALRRGERLACHLWLFRPSQSALYNIAASDRAWRDRRTLQPTPIAWRSDFASVQAFCTGSTVSRSTSDQTLTRWNHVIGLPLYLRDGLGGRLPVGAVTWASTMPEHRSALREFPTRHARLASQLADALADVFELQI